MKINSVLVCLSKQIGLLLYKQCVTLIVCSFTCWLFFLSISHGIIMVIIVIMCAQCRYIWLGSDMVSPQLDSWRWEVGGGGWGDTVTFPLGKQRLPFHSRFCDVLQIKEEFATEKHVSDRTALVYRCFPNLTLFQPVGSRGRLRLHRTSDRRREWQRETVNLPDTCKQLKDYKGEKKEQAPPPSSLVIVRGSEWVWLAALLRPTHWTHACWW